MQLDDEFVYTGEAVGAAAKISRINNKDHEGLLWVQGSVALPTIGGYAEQELKQLTPQGRRYREFINFARVKTTVEGKRDAATRDFVTTAVSEIDALSIARDRFTAKRLVAKLVSIHPPVGKAHPRIILDGTTFGEPGDIRVLDHPVELELDKRMLSLQTEQDILEAFGSPRSRGNFAQPAANPSKNVAPKAAAASRPRQYGWTRFYAYTFVKSIKYRDEVFRGNRLPVADFGTIEFGTVLATRETKRVRLLRFIMGSPDRGEATCAEVRDNGERPT